MEGTRAQRGEAPFMLTARSLARPACFAPSAAGDWAAPNGRSGQIGAGKRGVRHHARAIARALRAQRAVLLHRKGKEIEGGDG